MEAGAAKARVLEKRIAAGPASLRAALDRVESQLPNDMIVRGRAVKFKSSHGEMTVSFDGPGTVEHALHRHAFAQMAERAGVPYAFVSNLAAAGTQWEQELASHTMREHYLYGDVAGSRFLVRSVPSTRMRVVGPAKTEVENVSEVRGFLSDKFRRLDSRPLLHAFAESCHELGAVADESRVSDLRVAVKALMPKVYEPVPGEVLCLGLEWGNSDFGKAKHSVRAYILRLTCLNGATMEDVLSQVHLGGRLAEDVDFSNKTYRLDTETSVSALRDVVRHSLSPEKVQSLLSTIAMAHERKIEWKGVAGKLARRLTKTEVENARKAFDSEDVVNLPPEKSLWRASNAISWLAGQAEDEDRRLELQRVAGEILDGKLDKEAA